MIVLTVIFDREYADDVADALAGVLTFEVRKDGSATGSGVLSTDLGAFAEYQYRDVGRDRNLPK